MPKAAGRPCRHAGCTEVVRDGSGWCKAHQSDRSVGRWGDAQRGTRYERGYGSEWEVTRKRILSRDKGLCQVCLQAGKYRPAKAVDHIIPKFEQGSNDDSNLQAICKACHDIKTADEARRARMG